MIRNAFGVGLLVAVVCSVLSVLFVSPTHAVLEKYSWKTYNQIGGRIGEYNRLGAGEGGATPIIFKQDANDVSKFVSDKPGNSCTGKLILTVIPNDSTGIITKEGDCSFFDNLDKGPVAIGAQDVARQAVTDEADKIRKLFTDEACKGQADLQKQPVKRQPRLGSQQRAQNAK